MRSRPHQLLVAVGVVAAHDLKKPELFVVSPVFTAIPPAPIFKRIRLSYTGIATADAMSPTALLVTLALLAPSSQAQQSEPHTAPPQVIRNGGAWDFPGGATIEVTRRLYHGADMLTKATIYWPQTDSRRACQYVIDVAADDFGNREPWMLVFSADEPVLWLARGHMSRLVDRKPVVMGRLVDRTPIVRYVRRLDLAKPEAIQRQSAAGSGPVGFIPKQLVNAIEQHMVMPPANQWVPVKSVDTAIKSRVIEVICRFRVQATDGQPLQGVPVRFAVVLASRPRHAGAKTPPPQALHAPSNSGLDIVHAVSSADGYVTALIPIARRARDRGAVVRPTLTSFAGDTMPPVARKDVRKLPPLHLTEGLISAALRRHHEPEYEGELVGHVFDPAGQPLANCTLSLVAIDQTVPAIDPPLGQTSKHGKFVIRKLSCEQPMRLTIRVNGQCTTLAGSVTPTPAGEAKEPSLALELGKADGAKTWTLKRRNK